MKADPVLSPFTERAGDPSNSNVDSFAAMIARSGAEAASTNIEPARVEPDDPRVLD
jgi:hypothetical protein